MRIIAVVGGSSCGQQEASWAEDVGCALAERGFALLCGGGGGVMEAACRGAQTRGGVTIGILPGVDAASSNRHLTLAIPTGLGHGRNIAVALGGEAVIAIGGSFGSLSEIAYALNAGRPVVGLGTWSLENSAGMSPAIQYASTPVEAVELAAAALEVAR